MKNIKNKLLKTLQYIKEDSSPDERNIHELLADEHNAVSKYERFAVESKNEKVKLVLGSISREEAVHAGELEQLLIQIGMSDPESKEKGANEVIYSISKELGEGILLSQQHTIEIKCTREAVKELVPLLNKLKEISDPGSSVNINIDSGSGSGKFFLDGDGASHIVSIDHREPIEEEVAEIELSPDGTLTALTPGECLNMKAIADAHEKELIHLNSEFEKEKDSIYHERDMIVSLLSKIYPSYLSKDHERAPGKDFSKVVYIESPCGQLSWHIADSELELFKHLEYRSDNNWDGHDTDDKYKRLLSIEPSSPCSEGYPFYDPFKFFETYYFEVYSSYKRNPSMYNKGRLQSIWEFMVELLTANRANTIRQKVITRFNQNTNK